MRTPFTLLSLILLVTSTLAYAETPDTESGPELTQASQLTPDKNQDLVLYALSLNGSPYKYGGRSVDTGFDCSGFVRYVFGQVAGLTLPHTARTISQSGAQVARSELQPGDLIFFNTLRRAFSHVGIYVGENRFIHASSSKNGYVVVSNLNEKYWTKRFDGARRYALAE